METIAIRNFNKHYKDLTAEELIVKYYQTYEGRLKPKQKKRKIKPKLKQFTWDGFHQLT